MPNDGPVLVDGDDFGRIRDAVRRAESYPQNSRRLPSAAGGAGVQSWYTARLTSGTADANGYYPAVITVYDTVAAAWTDYTAVFVLPLSGEGLTNATRYSVRPIGPYSTGQAFQVQEGIRPPAFSGAAVHGNTESGVGYGTAVSGGILTGLTWNVADWDSGGYSNVSNEDRLTAPVTGYYLYIVNVFLTDLADSFSWTIFPLVNGAQQQQWACDQHVVTEYYAYYETTLGVSMMMYLNAGDYVGAEIVQNCGNALAVEMYLSLSQFSSPPAGGGGSGGLTGTFP